MNQQQEREKVFPLFVPILWLIGGAAGLRGASSDQVRFVNALGLLLSAAALVLLFVVAVALW